MILPRHQVRSCARSRSVSSRMASPREDGACRPGGRVLQGEEPASPVNAPLLRPWAGEEAQVSGMGAGGWLICITFDYKGNFARDGVRYCPQQWEAP